MVGLESVGSKTVMNLKNKNKFFFVPPLCIKTSPENHTPSYPLTTDLTRQYTKFGLFFYPFFLSFYSSYGLWLVVRYGIDIIMDWGVQNL